MQTKVEYWGRVDTTVDQLELDDLVKQVAPKKASKIGRLLERLNEFRKFEAEYGELIPLPVAVGLLGVTKQRVYALIDEGRISSCVFEGHHYVTLDTVFDYAKSERKGGRPPKSEGIKAIVTCVYKSIDDIVRQRPEK